MKNVIAALSFGLSLGLIASPRAAWSQAAEPQALSQLESASVVAGPRWSDGQSIRTTLVSEVPAAGSNLRADSSGLERSPVARKLYCGVGCAAQHGFEKGFDTIESPSLTLLDHVNPHSRYNGSEWVNPDYVGLRVLAGLGGSLLYIALLPLGLITGSACMVAAMLSQAAQ